MFRSTVLCLGFCLLVGCASWQQPPQVNNCPDQEFVPPRVTGIFWYHRYLDGTFVRLTAQRYATHDLKYFDGDPCELTHDFRAGYRQAYVDLARGCPACVPVVPPKKYWHAWHRSCAGRDAVEEWFSGYRAGLDHGLNSGVSDFNRVVPNLDGGCVSAAYVNPYLSQPLPSGVLPADLNTLSDASDQAPVDTSVPVKSVPVEAVAEEEYQPHPSWPSATQPAGVAPADYRPQATGQ